MGIDENRVEDLGHAFPGLGRDREQSRGLLEDRQPDQQANAREGLGDEVASDLKLSHVLRVSTRIAGWSGSS